MASKRYCKNTKEIKSMMPNFFRRIYANPRGYEIMRTFQKFLISEDALIQYLANLEKNKNVAVVFPSCFLFDAFKWATTKEVGKWSSLHFKWMSICKEKDFQNPLTYGK